VSVSSSRRVLRLFFILQLPRLLFHTPHSAPHQPCVFSQSENAWNFNEGGGRAVGRDLSGILAQPLRGLRLRRAAALHIFPLKTI